MARTELVNDFGIMEDQSINSLNQFDEVVIYEEAGQLYASESHTDGTRKAVKKRRATSKAEYWVGYDIYVNEKGKRRAKCKFCKDKSYACDSNKVGNKNVRNLFNNCPENLANKGKGKQTQLVLDNMGDNG